MEKLFGRVYLRGALVNLLYFIQKEGVRKADGYVPKAFEDTERQSLAKDKLSEEQVEHMRNTLHHIMRYQRYALISGIKMQNSDLNIDEQALIETLQEYKL